MRTIENSHLYLEVGNYQKDIFEIIDEVKTYILTEDCPFLILDISKLNMIDATKACILCSTFHFAKYPEGTVLWQVNDLETLFNIRTLKLKNIKTEVKARLDKTIKYFEQNYRSNIL